jgi:molybdopterin synthase sulfur carrier subunit
MYFAGFRETTGRSEEEISTKASTTGELYDEISERYGFDRPKSSLRVAVNDEFRDWTTALQPEDRVAFIPPVSGG